MSDPHAAIDRLAATRRTQGEAGFSAYAFLALSILGLHAPDVLDFILDQTDSTDWGAVVRGGE